MRTILYLGFNNPKKYKRGVENVIAFQSTTVDSNYKFYFCFDEKNSIFRWNDIICLAIKHDYFWPVRFLVMYYMITKKHSKVLVHSHNYLMGAIIPARINLCTVHDGLVYQNKLIDKKVLIPFYCLIELLNYWKSKKIHFVSNFSRDQALIKPFIKKTVIIYNTCIFENLELMIGSTIPCTNESKKTILIVRSIENRARIDLVIETATKLSAIDPNYFFIVAGKGPLLSFYQKQILDLGLKNIELKGFVSDFELASLYRNSYLVMVPAEYGEGFGLPIIEGYFFNKPVIASNVCAIPEVIISESFLFENSSDSIIKLILNFESFECSMSFRTYYDSKFGLSRISRLYKSLYESLDYGI